MKRRDFITLLGGAAAAWPLAARAQQAGKVYRIGFRANDEGIPAEPAGQAFLDGLREGGFIEGKNIVIERRFAEGRLDRYADLVTELLRLEVDVLVTSAEEATLAAKRATTRIPIVMMNVSDPLGQGIVASLARPAGNITGFTNMEPTMAGKLLELLQESAPRMTRVAMLFNPATASYAEYWLNPFKSAAFAVAATAAPVHDASELEPVIAAHAREPNGGLIVMPDSFPLDHAAAVTSLAARYRLPAVYPYRIFAELGGLLTYGNDRLDSYRRAAGYADRILKGEKPGELPVQFPVKFELVVNLKAGKALGLQVPPTLLARADEVIE